MRERRTTRGHRLLLSPALAVPLALLLGAPALPAGAIAVSSPADLQPADFWIYVEGSNGAFTRQEAQDDAPVSIEIEDPVVGGVALTGHLLLDAERLPTGPATRVNAVLQSPGNVPVTTDLDLASFVTFDLAVLSPTASTAGVRIVGRGLGGAAGTQGDGVNGSSSRSSGYVTLYETNASGGFGTIVRTWEVFGNFTSVPIDEVVTLATNQLYRIVVRSLASVDLRTPTTLDQYAYMFVDPQLTLAVIEGEAELAVSANVPEALPEPGAGLLAGAAMGALHGLARRRRRAVGGLSGAGSPR